MSTLSIIKNGAEVLSEIVGLIGTITALVGLTRNMGIDHEADSTVVNIAVALEGGKEGHYAHEYSGRIDVRLFNILGDLVDLPQVDHFLSTGNTNDKIVYGYDEHHRGQQTPYILLTGNEDAVCVAWVSLTWPDTSQWAVTGDWAFGCNTGRWSYSNIIIGSTKDGVYSPKCMWIDENRTPGPNTPTAYQIYLPDFAVHPDGSFVTDLQEVCNGISFGAYSGWDPDTIKYWDPPKRHVFQGYGPSSRRNDNPGPDKDNTPGTTTDEGQPMETTTGSGAQSTGPSVCEESFTYETNTTNKTSNTCETGTTRKITSSRNITMAAQLKHRSNSPWTERPQMRLLSTDTRVITSSKPHHLASELCKSDNSWGPSFVSKAEGTFCDMSTKTLYSLCDAREEGMAAAEEEQECFDAKTMEVVGPRVAGRVRARRTMRFSRVLDWDAADSDDAAGGHIQRMVFKH